MRMPSIPKPAPKPASKPAPKPVESVSPQAETPKPTLVETQPSPAVKAPKKETPTKEVTAKVEPKETRSPKPKARGRKAKSKKAEVAPLPKPLPPPAKAKVKMTVYLSPKTRQTADAAIQARIQQFKMEYRSLSAVVIAALEWFLEDVEEDRPAFPVERLERHLAGESPYNAPIGLWMEEDLKRKYNLIPSGMRAELCDVIVATWMARILPGT